MATQKILLCIKLIVLFFCTSTLLQSCCKKEGCTDIKATNYDSEAEKNCCCEYAPTTPASQKGALLFWTDNPSCGNITVALSNGQQSYITGYYAGAPANCVNYFGGYFYLEEGNYTYQVSFQNIACGSISGSVTVNGNSCNLRKVL
ncbi:MAG TPA: hypothetical protein PKN75_01110 [Bacteroidia bacterium]|nr:hypothetical protein [Bacteroidia bacterium]HNU32171.1 hypothetical protein [Bacteroidia bacterium]